MARSSLKQKSVKQRTAENIDVVEVVAKAASNLLPLPTLVQPAKKKDALTAKQRDALIVKYRLKARKLGRSILRMWHSRLDIEEVDSIVDLSLCEAVKRFDPARGASFMTFLYYHLKGNLVRAVSIAANSNSVPIFDPADFPMQEGEGEHFLGHQFRTLTAAEVSEALSGAEAPLPDEVLWKKEVGQQSNAAFAKLDTLEKQIVERIYLAEEQIMDIARDLGYSRCHISRVKKRALETLYDEMSASMKLEPTTKRPSFDDETDVVKLVSSRRSIQRRRPRAKHLTKVEREVLAAVA